ncbi:hypothetical protein HYT55_04970 [Candidatus Woesearchaeota archaeon]|nr:hypothetical protein [Candidatus Woesearchaeota archaeon]
MITITCTEQQLRGKLFDLLDGVSEPLYRGLSERARRDYHREGVLIPYEGALAVGRGICFSNDLETALSYCKGKLIITSREKLDPKRQAVDTRQAGYVQRAEQRLRQRKKKCDGYELWEEVLREDTITQITPNATDYVFVRRTPVTVDEIIAEIEILGIDSEVQQ